MFTPGHIFETEFQPNPKSDAPFRWRATHADGKRAPKVILCNDRQIRAGRRARVRVVSVKKPGAPDRGHIEVEFVGNAALHFDETMYVDQMLLLKLQALIEGGMNILLDGPQGSGKTVLSRKIAASLGLEYVFFNCSAIYEPTDFLATLQLRVSESGAAETVWVPTDILRALEAANADGSRHFLIFLDELNRCREMARNGIMPALDATRRLYNPLTGSTILIPDNVLWIAAINNGSQFTGTTSIDPAQFDRFAPLKVSYPPVKDEVRILHTRYPRVSRESIELAVQAANAVRNDDNLDVDLSMRATDEVCLLLSHPNFALSTDDPLPELLKTSFCGRFPGEWNDTGTDAGMVWTTVADTLRKADR